MIPLAAPVFAEQPIEGGAIECRRRRMAWVAHAVEESAERGVLKPSPQRNPEPRLCAPCDPGTQVPLRQPLHHPLVLRCPDLECGREARRPFDERQVEERHASFQSTGHGLFFFKQKTAYEIGRELI